MKKNLKMYVNSVDKVKNFVKCNSDLDGQIDVISGRYTIDGKSIMGMFSLDLSKELDVVIEAEKEQDINDLIEAYKNNNLL